MNKEDLRSVLPPERRLPASRRTEIKEMLMQVADDSIAQTFTGPGRRRRRRFAGLAVAVAVVGLSTGAAAAVLNRDRPDPRQAAAVNEEIGSGSASADVHLAGWRPELSSERVLCVLPAGTIETFADEFPLDARLTSDILVTECVSGNDLARTSSPLTAASATVCVTDAGYPKPVVLVDRWTCERHDALRNVADADLDELNRLRALDVSFLAVPTTDGCPSARQASDWAHQLVRESGRPLAVEVVDEGSGCYRGVTDWGRAVVVVQAVGPQG